MRITNSYEAEIFLIFANDTRGSPVSSQPRTWASKSPRKSRNFGIRASSTCTLNFDDLKIPAENATGERTGDRDSKIGAIYEGTSNIQLQTIAKFVQKEYS
ncbi:Acyl-CoA dehydrogenase, mitochondrial [Mycena indigotica]|uniref:Acyl-CoA dehydrogenase, mitochondrial n=1 Tax=Mycena indigotica TaxID=2126181 RepID=A0A8H6VT83_9AGAR|nr:Acyl-CoA dehydrogenase, mitochondrial [Mycena indigotica]KAF7289203.1 Acyl-CoA dehydrogenase, mitochondrial [Mycena indigotica]